MVFGHSVLGQTSFSSSAVSQEWRITETKEKKGKKSDIVVFLFALFD
jgi:hypothetical protein